MPDTPAPHAELDRILGPPALLRSVHQPIVELDSGRTVGFEALVRGPDGSALGGAPELFRAAAASDRVIDLDWAARVAATEGVPADVPLFVNVEPEVLGSRPPAHLAGEVEAAVRRHRGFVEITERSIIRDPAMVFAAANRIRSSGWGLALDDVGLDAGSLALMPLLRPDVIKLDMALVQEPLDAEQARVLGAVHAQARRTGAVIVAEGVETAVHEQRARSIGADLVQGYRYGRPARRHDFAVGGTVPRIGQPVSVHGTCPAGSLRELPGWATVGRRTLDPLSRMLEDHALYDPDPPVVLAAFHAADLFGPWVRRRYRKMARRSPLVGIVPPYPAGADGLMACTSAIAVVGPHYAGALVAVETADGVFRVALTHHRTTVHGVARHLLARLRPDGCLDRGLTTEMAS